MASTKVSEKKAVEKKEKIERVSQNGVTRPADGTVTGNVWAIADKLSAKAPALRKDVLEAAVKAKINPSTAATQYGKWRKFHGLKGKGNE